MFEVNIKCVIFRFRHSDAAATAANDHKSSDGEGQGDQRLWGHTCPTETTTHGSQKTTETRRRGFRTGRGEELTPEGIHQRRVSVCERDSVETVSSFSVFFIFTQKLWKLSFWTSDQSFRWSKSGFSVVGENLSVPYKQTLVSDYPRLFQGFAGVCSWINCDLVLAPLKTES